MQLAQLAAALFHIRAVLALLVSLVYTSSNPCVFLCFVFPEQWQELSAGEPGGQGPTAPWDWYRDQETSHPPTGPRRSWRCKEK